MNAQETSIKHSALGWVKKSIDDNLAEIEVDLKAYIEAPDDALLDSVKERLRLIQGVLMMIEQYGAAMLTEEMVALAEFIVDGEPEQGEQALEVMLRAVLQLPDYLEHIQTGHRDIPIAILPLLNDIRAVRNQDLFSEKLLFLPDLSMHQEGAEAENIDDAQNQASKLLAKKVRPIFQLALLNVIKDEAIEESLARLEKVCETLEERAVSEQVARIWWIIGALIESVSRQQLELGVSIKNLLGKVDALFRVILIIGERGLVQRQPIELIKNFLYYIAQPECDGPKAQAIKTAYRLEQFLPSERARSEVLNNIAGPNQALLKTVAEAMRADIEAVKSTLEVYVNGDLTRVEQLKDLPQEMHVISDTLAMIGLGPQRQLIEAQIDTVRGIVDGKQVADEEKLLSMAAELLQVEQALDQMQKRQPVGDDDARSESDVSRDYELDNVLTAVVSAALDDIQKTKNAILEFIKDPSKSENIDLCVTMMSESRGALELLNQPRAVAVVDGLLAYLKGHDIVEFMESDRLDALSQVVVSLEYYLEALGEHRSDADSILDLADAQLQELLAGVKISTTPVADEVIEVVDPDGATETEASAPEVAESPVGETETGDEVPATDAIVAAEISPDTPPEAARSGESSMAREDLVDAADATADTTVEVMPVGEELEVLKPDSDPDILEIYLEEADEESRNITRLQRDWLLHPEDENALKNIRRAFHTIKGSGRLVGATKIGEFAWDFEQLLNRVIDKTIAPSRQIVDAVGEAGAALSQLVEELKGGPPPQSDIPYLRGLARALAEFRADRVLIEHTRQKSAPESPYDTITGIYDGAAGSGPGIETQAVSTRQFEAGLLENIEPDTMVVDADELDEEPEVEFGRAASATQPARSPAEASTEVVDFAGEAPEADADEPLIEAVELGEVEPLPRETIEVQTIGEDFVTDDFDADFDAEVEFTTTVSGNFDATGTSPPQAKMSTPASGVEAELEVEEVEIEAPAEVEELEIVAPDDSAGEDAAASAVEEETRRDPFDQTTASAAPGGAATLAEPELAAPAASTDLSFDPELLIIYQQEVEQHLSTVNSVLEQSERAGELVPNEQLYRALHTIHGASRTADIASIGELAGLLEKPLKSAIAQKLALDHEIVALYREGQRAIEDMTRQLVTTRQLPRIPHDLEVSLKALAEDFEEHTVEIPDSETETTGEFVDTLTMMSEGTGAEQDDELLTIFVDEANELLEMSDNTLHEWSEQQGDDSGAQDYGPVMELQRYLHTLKGGARMAELAEISDLAHEMESVFIAVIDGRVDRNDELIDTLKDCFDLLHRQVQQSQAREPRSPSAEQVALLRELRRGEAGEVVEEAISEALDGGANEAADIVAENLTGEPVGGQERPSQDVIRVRADLLDNLVSSAGEVSIYRARMEQQVAGLGSYLGELGQTIARLKGQLRNLEAETETQIHYSHRAEATRSGEFDPLEMDRYTMIQELSRSLSESVNDLSSLQTMLGEQVKDSETLLLQQSRVNTDLQDGLIKSRMVKFSGLLSRLRRLVRQSSQELGKKAELVITGEDNEVDNKVLDRMVAPLEHIIRNALSHGIETPMERVKKGKPETGTIAIDIIRDGSDVVIRVSDDGAGVNLDKVRNRAIQLGLLDKKKQITDGDLVQFILEPGFSTADHVTQLSGRGVGMDVVDIEIKQLGGTLQIETNPQGTSFVARLPFTLSINQAILVRTGDETFAIPLINIVGITRLSTQQMVEYYGQENPEIEYAGQQFALHHLAKLVDAPSHFRPGDDSEKQPVIFSRSGDVRVALHVDEVLGNREIVVKTLGKQLSQIKGLAGASILADGSVVLILDVNGLVRHSVQSAVKVVYHGAEGAAAGGRDTVMVVDDSITMRRVASKLLERHNYQVVTAKDGVDALAQLEDVRPDVMLLDIEMPRMDGFELATHMQNEENYAKIPIIMITSRTGEKHRDRAFEIGVTNYMGSLTRKTN